MIKIVTSKGVSLDLAPDAEFVIEYNNPMMEDDRIPVPFSTDIALLPSETNCKTLGYLPAFKLEPTVREIAVSLVLDGIPFLKGTLSYSGIEDGRLNYTFAGKDIEDEWGKKIYESSLITAPHSQNENLCWPLMVNKDETGYYVKDRDNIDVNDTYNNQRSYVDSDVKYHNASNVPKYKWTPAIYAKFITAMLTMGDDINSVYQYVAVVGNGYGNPEKIQNGRQYNYAECLPDMTVVEFVEEVGKMFCAAVYEDGETFVMKSFASVSAENASLDWTSRVADEFSSEKEDAAGYVFGYDNSGEDSPNTGNGSGVVTGLEQSKTPLFALHLWAGGEPMTAGILPFLVGGTGDIISAENWTVNSAEGKKAVAIADVVFQNNLKVENIVKDADSVDNSCSFNLVKSVPSLLTGKTSSGSIVQQCSMAAIVEPINAEAERRSDVYIGLINNGQMTDHGHALSSGVPDVTANFSDEDEECEDILLIPDGSTEAISLRPDWLYEHFHKSYAAWLAKNRQLLSCDVDLNAFDLFNFRLYDKVLIHNRAFYVKKLTVTIKAGAKRFECSAEFISA